MSVITIEGSLEPKGYEQLTTLSSVKSLTPPVGARFAIIQATDQAVRWRDDGTNPTASSGMQLEAGRDFWYTGDLSALRIIEETASAKVNVSYYTG